MSKAIALHVIVGNFDDQLRTHRLPRQIFPLTPTTLSARHTMWLAGCAGLRFRPAAPRMSVERVLPIRRQKRRQLLPLCVSKAGTDADVLEVSLVVVKAEQQGERARRTSVARL